MYMYVNVCVYIYACIYACMYVCMYGAIEGPKTVRKQSRRASAHISFSQPDQQQVEIRHGHRPSSSKLADDLNHPTGYIINSVRYIIIYNISYIIYSI